MRKHEKLLITILRGTSDANVSFTEIRHLLCSMGFEERVRGSHHTFFKKGVWEIINLQPRDGKAKPYQVKQVRHIILKYRLGGVDNDQI